MEDWETLRVQFGDNIEFYESVMGVDLWFLRQDVPDCWDSPLPISRWSPIWWNSGKKSETVKYANEGLCVCVKALKPLSSFVLLCSRCSCSSTQKWLICKDVQIKDFEDEDGHMSP